MDIAPHFLPGHEHTCHANGVIVGGRGVVVATGVNENEGLARVVQAGAAARPYGFAARDKAAGEKVLVYRGNAVIEAETGAAVTHGTGAELDAAGRVINLAAGFRVGTFLADAAGPGGRVKLALEL